MDLLIDFLLALGTNLLASVVAGSLAMAMTLDIGLVFVAAHGWARFKSRD